MLEVMGRKWGLDTFHIWICARGRSQAYRLGTVRRAWAQCQTGLICPSVVFLVWHNGSSKLSEQGVLKIHEFAVFRFSWFELLLPQWLRTSCIHFIEEGYARPSTRFYCLRIPDKSLSCKHIWLMPHIFQGFGGVWAPHLIKCLGWIQNGKGLKQAL